ncbi:phage virion morphogenesis (putative tail completion) protein [Pantoea sesami]|nr:phage virion morphogenesis (putative tail completion) protein [Pantoea sesami]
MGITVEVMGDEKLHTIRKSIEKLADSSLRQELLESIGAVIESQTRRRIAGEKSSPAGKRWQPWSDGYAKTRHGNQSLLQGDGDLLDSIQYFASGELVHVGTPLPYGRTHQEGYSGSVKVASHKRLITQAFGRALKQGVWQTVGAHQRQIDMPQREFLGLSADNSNELTRVIGDFWGEVLQ